MADINISVIIPTYNRVDFLREAIESVLAQTYKNYEILVIDDGSTDNTGELAKVYADRIRYIYQDNRGPSAARNNGIRNANGDLVAFLDSDDLWHPEKLAKQVAVFEGNPSLGLIATGYENINTRHEIVNTMILEGSELKSVRRNEMSKNSFATSSVVVRKACFNKAGLFNEELHFAEDWEMWIRILKYFSFDFVPIPLMKYRLHPVKITTTSIHNNISDWRKVIEMHSCNGDFLKDILLKYKRLSWLYLNLAFVHRASDVKSERIFLIKSILSWPLWLPRRYSSLFRTLCPQNMGGVE